MNMHERSTSTCSLVCLQNVLTGSCVVNMFAGRPIPSCEVWHKDAKCFDTILAQLKDAAGGSYNVYHQILDTKDHGIPHSRKRLYIVGIQKSFDRGDFAFPEKIPCAPFEDRSSC